LLISLDNKLRAEDGHRKPDIVIAARQNKLRPIAEPGEFNPNRG